MKQKYSNISSSAADILMNIGGNVKIGVLHIYVNFDKDSIDTVDYREILIFAT